ncbi:hypothetical protein L7F22_010094 [Adiantum nelumboides]|nr:hypothetical protein [Adiantum nelumboides]
MLMQNGLLVQSTYNPAVHDACMSIVVDSHVWYFDNGATKHITSHRDLFTSLESVPHGNSVTCANNASYLVQGVGKIVLTATNGSSFTLVDALYVLGIKKNLLSVYALARLGVVVKFMDDRCIVHDLSFGDEIVASDILCRGLYKLTLYDKCGQNFSNAVVDTKAISDAKLWHARFGHLNFASLLHLHKNLIWLLLCRLLKHLSNMFVKAIFWEFDINAWPTTKPCFVGRFLQGVPSFRKKKDSHPQWTMQRVGAQGQQVTKALWEKYERKSWLLKDGQRKQSLQGLLEGGQQASYYLLVVHGKDILVKPAGPWYTFRKVTEYKQFTLEEAEERMKKRRKTADDYQRWLMKTANIGAAGFCEVEKLSGGGGGRGGLKGRADDVYDDYNSSFSDEGEDDAEEEENIKARLGINKKAGDEDGGKPARRDDRKLDDEEPERGDGWEHEQIFTDDDESAGHDTEESEDNPPEVPCSPEIKQV